MEIVYLNALKNNPSRGRWTNELLSKETVAQLEVLYNNSAPFPLALRELLYLAGNYCIVLDYGLNDTQQELQESVRAEMREEGRTITRPFYVIDVYNALDQFLFVYLDEGDNPAVHEGHYYDGITRDSWITDVAPSLSSYIDALIERVRNGQNPF